MSHNKIQHETWMLGIDEWQKWQTELIFCSSALLHENMEYVSKKCLGLSKLQELLRLPF